MKCPLVFPKSWQSQPHSSAASVASVVVSATMILLLASMCMGRGITNCYHQPSRIKKKTVPIKGPDVKRTRRDPGELEDIMIKLFERQPNWALKHLVEEIDQPARLWKDSMHELCVFNKRGINQETYELKPEN